MKRKFVFGLGTGCCGTSSLAYLLNSQPGAFVGHELFPILPWGTDELARRYFIENKWEQLNHESHLFELVGDVGSYYLPYARFLMFNLESLKDEVEFKFIILKRKREEVVSAFLEKFKRQNNNPFQVHKAFGVRSDNWDDSFPKFEDGVPLEKCIEWYYDDYYAEADHLLKTYPDNFRIYSVEDLNDELKVSELLSFVGVEKPNIILARKNKREDATIF